MDDNKMNKLSKHLNEHPELIDKLMKEAEDKIRKKQLSSFNIETQNPNIQLLKKKGFEKFYGQHIGKITVILGILVLILAGITIVESYYIFLWSH